MEAQVEIWCMIPWFFIEAASRSKTSIERGSQRVNTLECLSLSLSTLGGPLLGISNRLVCLGQRPRG